MIDTAALHSLANSGPAKAPEFDLKVLFDAGVHFGHQARKWHPKMKEWIFTVQEDVHIFDLEKTAKQMQLAYNYFYQLGKEGKSLVIIGTKRQAREVVKAQAVKAGVMHIVSRWLGGLLTNWPQVQKSLRRMVDIETGLQEGKFQNYTKYERVLLEKEKDRLARFFGGIRGLEAKPDALFVIDPSREKVVIQEANATGVPIVALVDSNTNPDPIDIVIPGNDDLAKSIETILDAVLAGYVEGRKNK